jgi:ATP-dependent Clp protease ATP-binding subunit ClpC
VLIFIDELHTLVGAGAAEGAIDASNMLKPALSRGEIQCIGATTLEEYRKYIEKDGALERRFQSIIVEPPSAEQTVEIIKGLRARYEEHHNVQIPDETIEAAVALSDRYIADRFLPDKAIDVIDEAGSRARLQASIKPSTVKDLEKRLTEIDDQIRVLRAEENYDRCAELKSEREETLIRHKALLKDWQDQKEGKDAPRIISTEDVAHIVAKWTGIPVTRIEEGEQQKLLRMEEELARRVVSQKDAVKAVSRAIRRSRSGLKDPNRPVASFIFLGPTGVGKTELAKALAEFMFGTQDSLIRVDMSEYMEKYSVSRLMGAPPGYVGYEEGGQLTEKVRQKPYSVVLLDEIEKAHPDVFSLLLQVLDDGRLTDSWGHTVDFRNTVIIMTSNVGTRRMKKGGTLGFSSSDRPDEDFEAVKQNVMSALKQLFNPEFINRLDDTIVFRSLEKHDIENILDMLLARVNARVSDKNIRLELTPESKAFLVDKGYDQEYGARPLRRTIQKYVEDPLSTLIIEGSVPEGQVIVEMDPDRGNLHFASPAQLAEATEG